MKYFLILLFMIGCSKGPVAPEVKSLQSVWCNGVDTLKILDSTFQYNEQIGRYLVKNDTVKFVYDRVISEDVKIVKTSVYVVYVNEMLNLVYLSGTNLIQHERLYFVD